MNDDSAAGHGGSIPPSPVSSGFDKTVWIIPAVIVVLDQITKWTVHATMSLYESIEILGDWVRLTYIQNPGGAFGVRWGHDGVYFVAAAAVIVWIVWHLWRHGSERRLSTIALALVLGGAVGNMIDRVALGGVIDFIDVEFPDMRIPAFDFWFIHHSGVDMDRWPTFNVADSAVSIAIVILLVTLFRDPLIGRTRSAPVVDAGQVDRDSQGDTPVEP